MTVSGTITKIPLSKHIYEAYRVHTGLFHADHGEDQTLPPMPCEEKMAAWGVPHVRRKHDFVVAVQQIVKRNMDLPQWTWQTELFPFPQISAQMPVKDNIEITVANGKQ